MLLVKKLKSKVDRSHKFGKKLYFLAVIPDDGFCKETERIKMDFAEIYYSKAALKAPSHITIFPPFHFYENEEDYLKEKLNKLFSRQQPFTICLKDYNCFAPRVIYIDVVENEFLVDLYNKCGDFFEKQLGQRNDKNGSRNFSPHLTVAFKDLSKKMFYKAWEIYGEKKIYHEFLCETICLLKHERDRWEVVHRARFAGRNAKRPGSTTAF